MDIVLSTLFSPTVPFLLWAIILGPFLVRREGLAPLHVATIMALSGLAVIASPSLYSEVQTDSQRWLFYVLSVVACTVASYFGKRLYQKQNN